MVPPWSMCGSRFIVGGKNNPQKSEDHNPYTYSVLNDKVFLGSMLPQYMALFVRFVCQKKNLGHF